MTSAVMHSGSHHSHSSTLATTTIHWEPVVGAHPTMWLGTGALWSSSRANGPDVTRSELCQFGRALTRASPSARNEQSLHLMRSALTCFLQSAPYCIVSRYYFKYLSWHRNRHRRWGLERQLTVIRRRALKQLVSKAFLRWCGFCLRRDQQRSIDALSRARDTELLHAYLRRWFVAWRRRQHHAHHIVPALHHIQRSAARALLRRSLHYLWLHCQRRQRLRQLRDAGCRQFAQAMMHRWMRRRFRTQQVSVVQRMSRRNTRVFARSVLAAWLSRTVRSRIATHVEQQRLQQVACRYASKWERYTRLMGKLRALRHSVSLRRMQYYYSKWVAIVWRTIRSYLLEQRHLAVLVQRYFIAWKLAVEEKTLLYSYHGTSRRSRSASLTSLQALAQMK